MADLHPSGRFAPSPTGDFHLGNLRTALLSWAIARSQGARFVIRMEDLDERSRPEYVARQLHDLEAIGVTWDGPVIFQSERTELYDAAFVELSARGLLYECYCTRKELAEIASAPHRPPGSYPGTCRDMTENERHAGREKLARLNRGPALRLRVEGASGGAPIIAVQDRVCGRYEGLVDDLVIRRGDGVYSYNYVSVFDDADSGITQIVRGDDLLPSTPRQIYLQRVLGAPQPEYYHVPLALNTHGVRLAKRDGAVTLSALAECGWSAGDVVELIGDSLGMVQVRDAEGFLEQFSLERIGREPWIVEPIH